MTDSAKPTNAAPPRLLAARTHHVLASASDRAHAAAMRRLLFTEHGAPRTPTRAEWRVVMDTLTDAQGTHESVNFSVLRELLSWAYWHSLAGQQRRFDPFETERHPLMLFYDLLHSPADGRGPTELEWEMIAHLVREGCDEPGQVHAEHFGYLSPVLYALSPR